MSKLLVNTPSGEQAVIEIGPGGGYFDATRVLWDESVDGVLPSITLGSMVRSGGSLTTSQTKKDEHDAATALNRARAAARIDDAVAAVYGRFSRFAQEYEDREAQAKAYKSAGYTGNVPRQVAAFATPAGKTAQEAADIVISQSAQLRGALDELGVLRMRKYEVLRAVTDAAARTAFTEILAAVAAINAAIS